MISSLPFLERLKGAGLGGGGSYLNIKIIIVKIINEKRKKMKEVRGKGWRKEGRHEGSKEEGRKK